MMDQWILYVRHGVSTLHLALLMIYAISAAVVIRRIIAKQKNGFFLFLFLFLAAAAFERFALLVLSILRTYVQLQGYLLLGSITPLLIFGLLHLINLILFIWMLRRG